MTTSSPRGQQGALGRLREERKQWRRQKPFGFWAKPCTANPNADAGGGDEDMFRWHAAVPGKKFTPWEGMTFYVTLNFPDTYPAHYPTIDVSHLSFEKQQQQEASEGNTENRRIYIYHESRTNSAPVEGCDTQRWNPNSTLKDVLIAVQNVLPRLYPPALLHQYSEGVGAGGFQSDTFEVVVPPNNPAPVAQVSSDSSWAVASGDANATIPTTQAATIRRKRPREDHPDAIVVFSQPDPAESSNQQVDDGDSSRGTDSGANNTGSVVVDIANPDLSILLCPLGGTQLGSMLVFDTCSLLKLAEFAQLRQSTGLEGSMFSPVLNALKTDNTVLIPNIVLHELDEQNKRGRNNHRRPRRNEHTGTGSSEEDPGALGLRARLVRNWIGAIYENPAYANERANVHIQRVTEVDSVHQAHSRSNDDKVLGCCVFFQHRIEQLRAANSNLWSRAPDAGSGCVIRPTLLLVTEDVMLRVKALGEHVPTVDAARLLQWFESMGM